MARERFDLIIAGAGPAAFALLDALERAQRLPARVALIDRTPARGNDRTWCFWERTPGPFEDLVAHTWPRLYVHGPDAASAGRAIDIEPYRYKLIRAGDFFAAMQTRYNPERGVERIVGESQGLVSDGAVARVEVAGRSLEAPYAFDATGVPQGAPGGYHWLWQHFLGLEVRTPHDAFDPGVAIFMDFRVPQVEGTCFVYVLPTSAREALIEYTVFSERIWTEAEYLPPLSAYIAEVLGLGAYEVLRTELGAIPMTDRPFAPQRGERVITIGTAGGLTKASTGYTFTRVVRHAQALVDAWTKHGEPRPVRLPARYNWMDGVMLRTLAVARVPGAAFFTRLFERNPMTRVLSFLDEETTLAQDLALMATVDVPRFALSALEVSARRAWHARSRTR